VSDRSSLQASAQILQRNLQTVLHSLSENADLFSRMALHPSPNYPGRHHEGILTLLLRKKLEPDVEELVERGRETARLVTPEGLAMLQEVWDECHGWTKGRVAQYVAEESGDVYTREEREAGVEGVRTGLKRDLEEDDDDDGDEDEDVDNEDEESEEDESEDGAGESKHPRGMEPETLLWFLARGDFAMPPNVEFERKVGAYKGLMGVSGYQPPQTHPQPQPQTQTPTQGPDPDAMQL
jgi:mediator of RNA polymerase II transcription subunit 8, fungi type